jgi:outer membrane protein assembly factor BamA
LRKVGIFGQVFVDAGTVLPLSGPGAASSIADVGQSMRAAAGAVRSLALWNCSRTPSDRDSQGVVFPTRIGRLEVNYCVTLRAKEHDRPKRGVQFGLRPYTL